jgi:hypothetical protein
MAPSQSEVEVSAMQYFISLAWFEPLATFILIIYWCCAFGFYMIFHTWMLADGRENSLFVFNLIFFFVCLTLVLIAIAMYSGERQRLKDEMEKGKQVVVEVKDLAEMMPQDTAPPPVAPAASAPEPVASAAPVEQVQPSAVGESDC